MSHVFSAKIWLVETSVRIVKYKLRFAKLNPVIWNSIFHFFDLVLSAQVS